MTFIEAQHILKAYYGCTTVTCFLAFPSVSRAQRIEKYRRARAACAQKLGEARRRRVTWEIDAHKDHLVGFDAAILARNP